MIEISSLEVDDEHVFYSAGLAFSGVAASYWPSGKYALQQEFMAGIPEGWRRTWYESGSLKSEGWYVKGSLRRIRDMFENGHIKSELCHTAAGTLLMRCEWDENGKIVAAYGLENKAICPWGRDSDGV